LLFFLCGLAVIGLLIPLVYFNVAVGVAPDDWVIELEVLVVLSSAIGAMWWVWGKIGNFSAGMIESISAMSSQAAFKSLGVRRLVIRAIDDEAALVISAGAIGSRLSSLFLSLIGFLRVLSPSILLGVPIAVFIIALWMVGLSEFPMARLFIPLHPAEKELLEFFAMTAVAVIGGSIAAIASLLVTFLVVSAALFRMAYGREMSLAGLNCEVSAHTAPDGLGVSVVTLRQPIARRGLRHYTHQHPQCVGAIFKWIESQLRQRFEAAKLKRSG